jgi:hypothetical protein
MNNLRGGSRSFRGVRWAGVLLIALSFAVCGNGGAQTTGALLGTVSDQNGAVTLSFCACHEYRYGLFND